MKTLSLNETYTREDVHGIFSPETRFIPQAGTWGLHGVVPVPYRPGDWVFFVSYGQSQAEHKFDEGITEDGVLTWQSQPRQDLNDARIREWINHNESINTIHLFLRESLKGPYTYFGRLKYLTHDTTRSQPVHFQWELLDWDKLKLSTEIKLEPREAKPNPMIGLREVAPPTPKPNRNVESRSFKERRKPDYAERDAKNRKVGLSGELLVIQHEQARLHQLGRPDLAELIVHVSEVEGDGAGYDIRSFKEDGSPLFIEVKSTRGEAETSFFISAAELEFSDKHPDQYALVRVFNLQDTGAEFYRLTGNLREQLQLDATAYRAKLGVGN